MVQYSKLNISDETLSTIFGERVLKKKKSNRVYVYGGIENGKLICATALSQNPGEADTIVIEDIYVSRVVTDGEMIEYDIKKELLSSVVEFVLGAGYNTVYCKLCAEVNDIEEQFNLFSDVGFETYGNVGHLTSYTYFDILTSETWQKTSDFFAKSSVESERLERDDIRFKHFNIAKEQLGILLDFNSYNPEYSLFHLDNNEVDAAVISQPMEEGDLFIYEIYKSKNITNPSILPGVFCNLMYKAGKKIPPFSEIYIQTFSESVHAGITGIIDTEPNEDKIIVEMALQRR